MLAQGHELRDEYVFEALLNFESGVKALDYFLSLDDPPTAIMTNDDLMAAGVFNRCYHLGIHIPEDLSVTGFGNYDVGPHLSPTLTTIGVKIEEMGRNAAELMLKRLEMPDRPPEKMLIDYDLIIRESTGPI